MINTVGAISEILGLFKQALLRNGFDEDETLFLCQTYLEVLATPRM